MMRAMDMEPDNEDDEARRSQTLLETPQRSHEESTNKYKVHWVMNSTDYL
jgi:hypothetical protein